MAIWRNEQAGQAGQGKQKDSGMQGIVQPSLSLPKGGGALRGFNENFSCNTVTGAGSMVIPLVASPGRSGFGPELKLIYNTNNGNGIFGFGWSLNLPTISRKTEGELPRYQDAEHSDKFIIFGEDDLVPELSKNGELFEDSASSCDYIIHRFKPRVERLFQRIERWTQKKSGIAHWRTITVDNVTCIFGKKRESRIYDPKDPTRIFTWLPEECYDAKGNAMVYEYVGENKSNIDFSLPYERNREVSSNKYLKRIKYGNRISRLCEPDLSKTDFLFELVFDYEDGHYLVESAENGPLRCSEKIMAAAVPTKTWPVRPDPFSFYRAGFEIRTYRRCRRVLNFHRFDELDTEPYLVKSMEFDYGDLKNKITVGEELTRQGSSSLGSFIKRIIHAGYIRDETEEALDKGGVKLFTYIKETLPPLELEYSKVSLKGELVEVDCGEGALPGGGNRGNKIWVDLAGEGLVGVLTELSGAWNYQSNLGQGQFGAPRLIVEKPSFEGLALGKQRLIDLTGSGQLSVACMERPNPGFFKQDKKGVWQTYQTFGQLPNISWHDSNLMFLDLDGDGQTDILVAGEQAFTWYQSLGEKGYGEGENVYQPFDPSEGSCVISNIAGRQDKIYLADMTGDGLLDLVRINNGSVCYWPNLGYGRFGAKVTMAEAPIFDCLEEFDYDRLHLADIDGTGSTDLIYQGRDGVYLFFNYCGNAWSEPCFLSDCPLPEKNTSMVVTDLLGTGCATLVWHTVSLEDTQRPLRYMELTGGIKPHLLNKIINNLGLEVRVNYTSSTHFYLEDKRMGRPWVRKLPFPVQVVESIESIDHICGNRFVTRYAYHHGYFDGLEREFRGFGLVETWDSEDFDCLRDTANLSKTAKDSPSHILPPVFTRTWYHLGIDFSEDEQRAFLALAYRDGTDLEKELAGKLNKAIPAGLCSQEKEQALRALKGLRLRQEVYALDNSTQEKYPYQILQENVMVKLLQSKGGNKDAVFFVGFCEKIDYSYERDANTPRIVHTLNLDYDEFGNVLKSVEIAYGHPEGHNDLMADEKRGQCSTLIAYQEYYYTQPLIGFLEGFRGPMLCETKKYELTGYSPTINKGLFKLEDFVHQSNDETFLVFDEEIPYESLPSGGRQRRLVKNERILYQKDNLRDVLPLGKTGLLGLVFEKYQLAFTEDILHDTYSGNLAEADLMAAGYRKINDSKHWWASSGRVFYSLDSSDSPALEEIYARQHFFMPCRFRDPFFSLENNSEKLVIYDKYDLLILETIDSLGNIHSAGIRSFGPGGSILEPRLDYRVLEPTLIMDPNGNCIEVAFNTLGLVVAQAVMGKPGDKSENVNSLTGAKILINKEDIIALAKDPLAMAEKFLGHASGLLIYDQDAYLRADKPIAIYSFLRETHGKDSRIQKTVSYYDGFGREIQKKVLADSAYELTEEAQEGSKGLLLDKKKVRWLSSGWLVYNNKGLTVQEFEPFYTDSHHYERNVKEGVSPVLCYDPLGRLIALIHPDRTWEKIVYTPWFMEDWDANDTALIEDPGLDLDVGKLFARLPKSLYSPTWLQNKKTNESMSEDSFAQIACHAQTPTLTYFDALGRPFLVVQQNRLKYSDSSEEKCEEEEIHRTRVLYDIEGREKAVVDPLGRLAACYNYDLMGNRISDFQMDGRKKFILYDINGEEVLTWNERGKYLRRTYDVLRRPEGVYLRENNGAETLVELLTYGESHPDPQRFNLRGQIYQSYDQGGLETNKSFDLDGNLIEKERRLAEEYHEILDWSDRIPLEERTYSIRTSFDALKRPVEVVAPDGSKVFSSYDDRGLLQKVRAHFPGESQTELVKDIHYDALGRKTEIAYGNGVKTVFRYDPLSHRLTGLLTKRRGEKLFAREEGKADRAGQSLQDLTYEYDPVGNILAIADKAQQTIFFRNCRVEPKRRYVYDALYRLLETSGREHLGQGANSLGEGPFGKAPLVGVGDGQAMVSYKEKYSYDLAGNILTMVHSRTDQANPGWTRRYEYNEESHLESGVSCNRLSCTKSGSITEICFYEGNGGLGGNITGMPHLSKMSWDYKDQLRFTAKQRTNGDLVPAGTWYVYDSKGNRLRKVSEGAVKGDGLPRKRKEQIYLDGFEIYREYKGDVSCPSLEKQTLEIRDEKEVLALWEKRNTGTDTDSQRLLRYLMKDHLGSVTLELSDDGQIISYEEYFPFGGTSYRAQKEFVEVNNRYRFCGRERDEESGFYYCGARYYAFWLGRWLSCDPLGLEGGINLYVYANNSPLCFVDNEGLTPEPPPEVVNPYMPLLLYQENLQTKEERWVKKAEELQRNIEIGRQRESASIGLDDYSKKKISGDSFGDFLDFVGDIGDIVSILEAGDVPLKKGFYDKAGNVFLVADIIGIINDLAHNEIASAITGSLTTLFDFGWAVIMEELSIATGPVAIGFVLTGMGIKEFIFEDSLKVYHGDETKIQELLRFSEEQISEGLAKGNWDGFTQYNRGLLLKMVVYPIEWGREKTTDLFGKIHFGVTN